LRRPRALQRFLQLCRKRGGLQLRFGEQIAGILLGVG
jgi:hypothetical protein